MNLIEELTQTAAISAREHRIRALIKKRTKGLFDQIRTDALGSLICLKKPTRKGKSKPLRIMVAAHMDQIGFMVKHVDDKGFLRLNPVGGFDARNLFARLCTVCPDVADATKDVPGVLNPGGKPIHIASGDDLKKIPELAELVVDLGLPTDEVRQKVRIGDMVVLKGPLYRVGNTVVSQCLDNRVACWIAIRAIEKLKEHRCEIYCVFTVQEEVGLRGAGTSAYAIRPDVGIGLDTTLCVDLPGVPEDQRCTKQTEGAALTVMDSGSITDLELLEQFEAIAIKKKIRFQRSILPRGATDSGTIQRAAAGARILTLSCPTRYIHTVTEMIHLDDLNACRDMLAAYLSQV